MTTFPQFPIYKVSVRDPTGPLNLITFVSPDEMGGIPAEAVVGKLRGPGTELVPDNFARNRAFVDFMHRIIQEAVPQIEEFVAVARSIGTGWLNIHDARAFNAAPKIAETDIIGSFRVERGVIIAGEYVPNPNRWILSEYGMVTPHPEIQDHILSAMRALKFNAR